MACVADEVYVLAISEGLGFALGDGVAADPVDGNYGDSVRMEDVWNAAFKGAEDDYVVGALVCGVRRCLRPPC